jgi:hypothetical protein
LEQRHLIGQLAGAMQVSSIKESEGLIRQKNPFMFSVHCLIICFDDLSEM